MKKRAAMELSMSTIVIVVLSMSMLILGLVLVNSLFKGAGSVVDMTQSQLTERISNIFGKEEKLAVYPTNREISASPGKLAGFGIGIKNLRQGKNDNTFSYEVIVSDPDIEKKCGVSAEEALSWISTGRAEQGISIAPKELVAGKVILRVPEGSELCDFRYRINAMYGDKAYASQLMDVVIE